ncbi:MAG: dihydrolipoyl dehydrogenase [Gammaproteobacteria bacterium]|nr:dihydrolipoyl dehydrogenase [Gammaproteobacteria bacterium]
MKTQSVELAILGAGTAGISAFKEASKVTQNIVMIDPGPLGTTCARVGCMPSKTLIQTAHYYHDRKYFSALGINGADKLSIDIPTVMKHVRMLRDYFTSGTIQYVESLKQQYIHGKAEIIDNNTIKVNDQKIVAKSIIIATGSASIIPPEWHAFRNEILISENIFEQKDFQNKIAVIGAGAVGLELGQALSYLDLQIEMFHSHDFIGGLTDPVVNEYAIQCFQKSFPLYLNYKATVEKTQKAFLVKSGQHAFTANEVIAALGREVNLTALNLNELGVKFDKNGLPVYNHQTMQLETLPIYIAGDVGKFRPLLHEAADEGRIAGYNAVRNKTQCFKRRTPLSIIFTQPNIAMVGQSFSQLHDTDFVIGEVCFEDQGRSRIMSQNQGLLRIYAAKKTGLLLGAEMIAPDGEHLAHILASSIQQALTVFDLLQMPFYHPVVEEGMRTALRHIMTQIKHNHSALELAMCDSEAASNLS